MKNTRSGHFSTPQGCVPIFIFAALSSPSVIYLMLLVSSSSSFFIERAAIAAQDQLIQSLGGISLISISTESSLSLLRPTAFLIEPVAAEKLANASIFWLFLWRFEGDEAIKVLVDWGWIA